MKIRQFLIINVLAVTSFLFCLPSSALEKIKIHPSVKKDISKEAPLPSEEVERFVTAIAVIKKYYIKEPTDKNLFTDAIKGMVSSLDPHSSYLDAEDLKDLQTAVSGEFVGVGVELTTQGGALKVVSPLRGLPRIKPV